MVMAIFMFSCCLKDFMHLFEKIQTHKTISDSAVDIEYTAKNKGGFF